MSILDETVAQIRQVKYYAQGFDPDKWGYFVTRAEWDEIARQMRIIQKYISRPPPTELNILRSQACHTRLTS